MNEYKYILPNKFINKVKFFSEFKTGGMQVTVITKDGKKYEKILISNCKYIIAMRGYKDLPFSINDVVDIIQTEDDKNPKQRGEWYFWEN